MLIRIKFTSVIAGEEVDICSIGIMFSAVCTELKTSYTCYRFYDDSRYQGENGVWM